MCSYRPQICQRILVAVARTCLIVLFSCQIKNNKTDQLWVSAANDLFVDFSHYSLLCLCHWILHFVMAKGVSRLLCGEG